MMKYLSFFCLLLLAACNTTKFDRFNDNDRPTITASLFDYKDKTISEENIQRILDGKIQPPDTVRIVVYKFSGRATRSYSTIFWRDEDRLKIDQQILDTLSYEIQQSKRVQKVLVMPTLVVGFQPNIHQIREAAVRLQADIALIFSIESDLFYQYRTFKKDDAKAFATCEAVLMDIRTGIIPHSSVLTRQFYSKKLSSDLTLDDMRRRVQNAALMEAMSETGRKVAGFLK